MPYTLSFGPCRFTSFQSLVQTNPKQLCLGKPARAWPPYGVRLWKGWAETREGDEVHQGAGARQQRLVGQLWGCLSIPTGAEKDTVPA